VAILGCAGSNGLPKLAAAGVSRIVAIDINPNYFVGGCARDTFACEPVDLVFAGLIFEFVPAGAVFACAAATLKPAGRVVAMIQLPSATAEVTTFALRTEPRAGGGRDVARRASDARGRRRGRGFAAIERRTIAVTEESRFK